MTEELPIDQGYIDAVRSAILQTSEHITKTDKITPVEDACNALREALLDPDICMDERIGFIVYAYLVLSEPNLCQLKSQPY